MRNTARNLKNRRRMQRMRSTLAQAAKQRKKAQRRPDRAMQVESGSKARPEQNAPISSP
jgi:hypothetical protein